MPEILLGDERTLFQGQFVTLVARKFSNPRRNCRGEWEFLRRPKAPGRIVAVLPVTPKREVVLVKIFRVPFEGYVIEPCAGLPDKEGEDERALGQREMLEETGYESDELVFMCAGPFCAGVSTDQIAFYLAPNARKVAEPKLEPAEDLEVVLVPVVSLGTFLRTPQPGVHLDVKLWSLVPFLCGGPSDL